jgi:glycosyltransferase involved in cell wall biosynthesis
MLQAGGMTVTVIGFRRRIEPVREINSAPVIDLGVTRDGGFAQRVWAVFRTLLRFGIVTQAVLSADVCMARNLEMLVIAVRARGNRRLVYECLDIHRLLLGKGIIARSLGAIERFALTQTSLIITSSSRFVDDYFRLRRGVLCPILLVENKVLALEPSERRASTTDHGTMGGPPWVIGWFGMLRCRRSLLELTRIAAQSGGAIKVLIAGIASEKEFVDFAGTVASLTGLEFVGRYTAEDLPQLYARVHFAWAIDFFEEGLNSAWLLPNRLYEAMAHGAVPVALTSVETGNWLKKNNVGITVQTPASDLLALLARMDEATFQHHRAKIAALADHLLFCTRDDCHELVDAILPKG